MCRTVTVWMRHGIRFQIRDQKGVQECVALIRARWNTGEPIAAYMFHAGGGEPTEALINPDDISSIDVR